MAVSPPVSLPDAEKLDALRRLDQFREWQSLDDRRYCLVCGKIITGRQIQGTNGRRGTGPLRVVVRRRVVTQFRWIGYCLPTNFSPWPRQPHPRPAQLLPQSRLILAQNAACHRNCESGPRILNKFSNTCPPTTAGSQATTSSQCVVTS